MSWVPRTGWDGGGRGARERGPGTDVVSRTGSPRVAGCHQWTRHHLSGQAQKRARGHQGIVDHASTAVSGWLTPIPSTSPRSPADQATAWRTSSETSPCRRAGDSKRRAQPPKGDGDRKATRRGNRDPRAVGATSLHRVGSVRLCSVVGLHRVGDGSRWLRSQVRSPTRGPIQASRGQACAAVRRFGIFLPVHCPPGPIQPDRSPKANRPRTCGRLRS
jgi:hypothetical protein